MILIKVTTVFNVVVIIIIIKGIYIAQVRKGHKCAKEAPMPKTNTIRSPVSIELRLVTNRQTDTGPWLVAALYSIASCG